MFDLDNSLSGERISPQINEENKNSFKNQLNLLNKFNPNN